MAYENLLTEVRGRVGLRDLLCSGVFVLTALVVGAAQARQHVRQAETDDERYMAITR